MFIAKKIFLEQALQRGTTPKEGFFTLVFVKETAFCHPPTPTPPPLICWYAKPGVFMIQKSG